MTTETPVAFVVDDDEAVRDALALHLDLAGLSVRCCASAAEFLETASPDQPGCAILDIRMPGMDGLDLQQEMARRGLTMPVIIITGHVMHNVTAADLAGDFLYVKPVDPTDVLDDIGSFLASVAPPPN